MIRAIVGANWGDEGKGKITDVLAADSDVVVRFQGGSNAGHTISPTSSATALPWTWASSSGRSPI